MSASRDTGIKLSDEVYNRVLDKHGNIILKKLFEELWMLITYPKSGECFEYFTILRGLLPKAASGKTARLQVTDITDRNSTFETDIYIKGSTFVPAPVSPVPNLYMIAVFIIDLVRSNLGIVDGRMIVPPNKTAAFDFIVLTLVPSEGKSKPAKLGVAGVQVTINDEGHQLHSAYKNFYTIIDEGLKVGAKAGLHSLMEVAPAYLLVTPPGVVLKGRHKFPDTPGHRHLHAFVNLTLNPNASVTTTERLSLDSRFAEFSSTKEEIPADECVSSYQTALRYVKDMTFGTENFRDFADEPLVNDSADEEPPAAKRSRVE